MDVVEEELEKIPAGAQRLGKGDVSVVACCPLMVRFRIRRSKHRELDLCLNFPPHYPDALLFAELKSRRLPPKFTDSIVTALEKAKEDFIGKPHILQVLRFTLEFLDANPLCVAVQEISDLRRHLSSFKVGEVGEGEGDWLKVRQKSSAILARVEAARYFLQFRLSIPDEYPDKQVELELKETNFPQLFRVFLFHQGTEMARQCVQPPLLRRKKGQKAPPPPPSSFQVQPSLEKVGRFLVDEAKRYPVDPCPICKARAFPEDPADVAEEFEAPEHIERVYCGHIFHFRCIDVYMKTPPFKGGKPCPACKATIYHDKWKDSEKTREERWAHKEAKQRELEEVQDFLS